MKALSDIERTDQLAKENYDLMANEVRKFNLMDCLLQVKQLIQEVRASDSDILYFEGGQCGIYVFPFLIDLIVRNATTLPAPKLSRERVGWILSKYNSFPDILGLPFGKQNVKRYRSEYMIRTGFLQLPPQEMNRTIVPRNLFLYKIIPLSNLEKHKRFLKAISKIEDNQLGFGLDKFLFGTALLAAKADKTTILNDSLETDDKWFKNHIDTEEFRIVLAEMSYDRGRYREVAIQTFSEYPTRYVTTQPFAIHQRPVLKLGKDYIAPSSFLILDKGTKLLHEYLQQYFRNKKHIHELSDSYGNVFEEYIGIILAQCYGAERVVNLNNIISSNDSKADWIVIVGNCAAIFECKAQRYPSTMKRTGDVEILESFVDKRISIALEQLNEIIKKWPQIEDQLPQAKNVPHVFRYIVLDDHFRFANRLNDFIPDNKVVQELINTNTKIISVLDMETVAISNYAQDFESVYCSKREGEVGKLPLEQYIRGLPDFAFTSDNFLGRKFNEFFHIPNGYSR